ncbi:hypothetical protein, partial [Cloacibacillus porcorum]|uniref:hypothetical protein n=1 Tax=Cloacibacillus porcorum TaxID=1197717 RepID=UPI003F089BDB
YYNPGALFGCPIFGMLFTPACCGNMDNLKMPPPCGGDIALQSTHRSAPAVFRPYFASSSTRLNADFLRVGKAVNYDLAFDFALKGALCEAAREPNQSSSDLCDSAGSYIRAGSAVFFRRD